MQVWIGCPQFHKIRVWTTHMPSNKIPKNNLRSRVSKTSVNHMRWQELGLMTQANKDLCMDMLANVQRCKEVKNVKQVAQSKQGKHNIAQS